MRTTLGALALVGLLALTGCATPADDIAMDAESTAPTASSLDGQWRLAAATDAEGKIDLKTSITTITLTGDDTGGKSACNSYDATVEIGAGHDITIARTVITQVGCDDAAFETIESRYMTALTVVDRSEIVEKQLVLSNEDEEIELVYDAITVTDEASLVGANWQLESTLSGTAPDVVAADVEGAGSILFNDSDFEASGGCSTITGDWTLTGGVLITTDVEIDTSDCSAALIPQEKIVEAVLRGPSTVSLDDTQLSIDSAKAKAGLLFRSSNN